jgi:hypothetical protein
MGTEQSKHKSAANKKAQEAPPSNTGEKDEIEPLPKLNTESEILTEESIKFLSSALIQPEQRKQWKLLFNSKKNGKSFNRFCYYTTGGGPNFVLIRDMDGYIFGGFAESWKDKHPKFYGSKQCFVFSLNPSMKIYRPTGFNDHFQYLNFDTETLFNGFGQGGQLDFFAWGINQDFEHGQCRGETNLTFGNPPLSKQQEWLLDYIEVWEVEPPPQDDYEIEKINKKKGKTKSALDEEGNAERVLLDLAGKHTFSHFNVSEEMMQGGATADDKK